MVIGAEEVAPTDDRKLHRSWKTFESFQAAFGGLYFTGGLKILYSTGIYSGGPAALWSSWIVTAICSTITAACLAEICSSIPLSGSIYLWAAASAGPKYGRFFGFLVAFWTSSAWTSFVASTGQATANFILSELVVFNRAFPGGVDNDNVRFRAVVWVVSEALLALAVLVNFMHPRKFRWIFRFSAAIMAVDFLVLFIALPVGVSKRYGFQSAEWVFTSTFNGTGASPGWNWVLSFLSTAYVITGFDAAAHVSDEVQNPSLAAARGVFWSAATTAVLGFPLLLILLFCSPDIEALYELAAPQPLVLLFQNAVGTGGQLVLTVISIAGLLTNISLCVVSASRLVNAIARDGILPGSSWIAKTDKNGAPRNAVIFVWAIASVLLCSILGSTVAFTSLISISGVPTIASYALIPILRLMFTRGRFKYAKWSNGRFSTLFCIVAAVWNLFICCVMFSPYVFPVTAQSFNYSSAVFFIVSVMAVVTWWIVPEERWLSKEFIIQAQRGIEVSSETGSVEKF
ncbi:hypothetical protein OIV83_000118 [Microbotryomycetes sp. JL201]|nr:hypothetical protein OIV83_000118 [Microbotryomycetes sp. JL201]